MAEQRVDWDVKILKIEKDIMEKWEREPLCSLGIPRPGYPSLFHPRGAVRFVEVPGEVHSSIEGLGPAFRFMRLRSAYNTVEEGDRLTPQEEIAHYALLRAACGRVDLKEPSTLGLQSGGRSALRFLLGYRMIRIKGAEYGSQLRLFDAETPHGSSIEFYVDREMKNHKKIGERSNANLLAYTPCGFIDYGQDFHGSKVCAGLFEVRGDTRLDEVLMALGSANKILDASGALSSTSRILYKNIDEICFALGKIAGIRLKQLDSTGIPWSRKTSSTNSHIGNMVVYDAQGMTTIGFVDLDAAGGFLRSKSKIKSLIEIQYGQILSGLVNPVYLSIPLDHKIYRWGVEFSGYPPAAEGFVEGYHRGGEEWVKTADMLRIMADAWAIKAITEADACRRIFGVESVSGRTELHFDGTDELFPSKTGYLIWQGGDKDELVAAGLFPPIEKEKKGWSWKSWRELINKGRSVKLKRRKKPSFDLRPKFGAMQFRLKSSFEDGGL